MKVFNSFVATAALVATVLADCNPLKSSDCPANPALADSFKEDFSSKSKYFEELKSTGLSYGKNGAEFDLKERFDNPSIKSDFYIMFGKVEVVLKAGSGQGIISSFYLQSDDLDEIDIELFGSKPNIVQSNYFSKGDTSTYTRGEYHTISEDVTDDWVTYTLDWSKDSLSWAINGNVVRTLYPNDPQGFPQSPMAIYAGIWAGGDSSNPSGTIQWAGGPTTYGPTYSMGIKSLIVADYSTGDKYSYSDKSGDWDSIKSDGGKINGRIEQAKEDFEKLGGDEVDVSSETSTASTSSTSSSSSASSSTSSSASSSTSSRALSTTSSASSTSSTLSITTATTTSTTSSSSKTSTSKMTTDSSDSSEAMFGTTTNTATTTDAKSTSTTVWWTPTTSGHKTTSTATTRTEAVSNTAGTSDAPAHATTVVITSGSHPTTFSTVTSSSTESSTESAASSVASESETSDNAEILGSLDSGSSKHRLSFILLLAPIVSLYVI